MVGRVANVNSFLSGLVAEMSEILPLLLLAVIATLAVAVLLTASILSLYAAPGTVATQPHFDGLDSHGTTVLRQGNGVAGESPPR